MTTLFDIKAHKGDIGGSTYTPLGQPMERTTATGDKITYQYSFDRLTKINYPDSNDNVIYTYADSTVKDITQRCRLIRVDDASGAECYTYGDMGAVEETTRMIRITPKAPVPPMTRPLIIVNVYIYSATYDSWGRVREMTYPDMEKVTYSYYPTGELKSIVGQNNGKQDVYLKEAGYNLYGQTVYRHLGNGSKELFTFDENNRLETSTLELQGQTISTNTYRYDKADNITDIMQTAGAGGYLQHYEYDGLNRLVKATGRDNTPYGDAQYSHYTMEMAYNAMSSPVKIEKNLNGTFIRNEYLYGLEEHPNAPQQVGERRYTYSASGNPLTIEGGDVNRTLTWDSENRLRRIYDSRSGQLHLYTYNHLGERALKRYGKAQAMAVNDKDAGALLDTKDNYSAYVSPYFVRHNNRYTKHYYAGAMRIASKIGASGSTYAAGTDEPDLYFYHTDHLGSTTYITDRKEVAQYVAYTPYGETFKEYKNVTPYKFNGKELDQETGYYYYGARYYDPGTALWFGTDPLADKYPMNSPYIYCNGNPVKYVDPDGRDWYQSEETGCYTWFEGDKLRNGYSYVGGKGSVLGEFESHVDRILKDVFVKKGGLYSEGASFSIVNNQKGALQDYSKPTTSYISDPYRGVHPVTLYGPGLTQEFLTNSGPEISIFLQDHPYTLELMSTSVVKNNQSIVSQYNPHSIASKEWGMLDVVTTGSLALQFIGSYRHDCYYTKEGILNVVSDSKSRSSFFYHLTDKNVQRPERFGNTYQFYLWKK